MLVSVLEINMTTRFKSPTVAEYLGEEIEASGRTAQDIADAIGYDSADVIKAFTRGTAKVPVNKVGPLARALDIDAAYFLRLVLAEYMPDTLAAIDDAIRVPMLTENERGLIGAYRRATNGTDAAAVVCDAKDVVAVIMV